MGPRGMHQHAAQPISNARPAALLLTLTVQHSATFAEMVGGLVASPPGAQLPQIGGTLTQPVRLHVVAVTVALGLLGGSPPRPPAPGRVGNRTEQAA